MSKVRDLEAQLFHRVNPAVKFSVTRYVLAIGVFVAIVAFGVGISFNLIPGMGLGVDLMPSVSIPAVNVSTSYPGAAPSVVDQQVTQVVENAVSTLSGITDLSSSSSLGNSRVQITFDISADRNAMMNQVAALVNAAIRRLPSGVNPPVVRTFDPNSQPILQFGISGGGVSLSTVADYVNNTLGPTLERIDGLANVTVDGAPTRQFQVLLDPNKLKYYGLSPAQVVTAITSASVNQPIGTITANRSALTFSTRNVPEDLDHLRGILVDAVRGVAVGELSTVRDASLDSNFARINGQPVILVSIQRTTDSNAVAVVDAVQKALKGISLPKGYTLTMSSDSTGPIRASVQNTVYELLMTLIVVAIIVLLFLGKPGTALSVILAIPIAISAAPILYKLSGFSFNLVSLLAMVIAIGVVVDDSIVVAENVERYRSMGFSQKDAVLKGASEVFSAVVAASLSLLSVLLPVSFMGSTAGRYLQQFSLGLAAAVAFSLLEAILFLTVRLAYSPDTKGGEEGVELRVRNFKRSFGRLPEAMKWGFKAWRSAAGVIGAISLAVLGLLILKKPVYLAALLAYPVALGLLNYALYMLANGLGAISDFLHSGTEWAVGKVRDGYARSLGRVLKVSPWILVGSAIFLGGIAFFVVPQIPINFVPQSDSGSMSANVRFPPGTPQDVANAAGAKVEAWLMSRPEVLVVQSIIGGQAEEDFTLVPVGKRPSVFDLAQTYRRALQPLILKDFPTARLSVGTGGGGFGGFGGGSLQLSLIAADYSLLTDRNAAIVSALQENPWVADVSSSLSDTNLEQDFVPDPAKLKGTGITTQAIANALQTYASGSQASNVVTGGLSYPIMVKLDPSALSGGESLLDLPVYSTTLQTSLQIGQLGRFALNESPNSLSRYNRQYTGSLNINLKPGAPSALELQRMVQDDLTKRGLLDNGLSLGSGGRYGMASLASDLLATGPLLFLVALFLAYLVMAAQFNSWRYPIYLLLPVPLAIVGAFLLIFVVGGGIDIFGLMGMLMLIGLSAKNAILYLDFVLERIGKMPLTEALIEAARLRFRPIVMTTLTVLVISFPLIFSGGQGSEFGQRMGLVMLGGIVFSAILTFFVVPCAFFVFEKNRASSFDAHKREIEEACIEVESGELPTAVGDGLAPERGIALVEGEGRPC